MKSVEEKAADELDRKTSGKILGQSKENGKVLGMDSEQTGRIRTLHDEGIGKEEVLSGNQANLQCSVRGIQPDATRSSSVRQSSVCESGSPVSGNAERKFDGQNTERSSEESEQLQDALSEEAPVIRGESSDKQPGRENLQSLQQSEIGNAKTETQSQSTVLSAKEIRVTAGRFQPTTLSESTRIARGLLESGCIPKQYKTVAQVLMAQQTLRQLGLADIACLSALAIVNGTFSLWGEGPKAVCQAFIEEDGEFWFDKDYKEVCFANKNLQSEIYGAYYRVIRKGVRGITERVFTVDDAKAAKLWGKVGPWQSYSKRMLQCRARAWALRDAFPDKLLGVAIAEDFGATIEAGRLIETENNQAPRLAEKFINTPKGEEK